MRKSAIFLPAASVLAGIIGFFIRKKELAEVFEESTGLAVRGAAVSTALIALSVAVIVLSAIAAKLLTPGKKSAYAALPKTSAGKAAGAVSAVLFVFGAVFCIINGDVYRWRAVTLIFALFGLGSAAWYAVSAFSARGDKPDGMQKTLSVVPALFFCLWLIATYRTYATEPSLLVYCYECLAAAAMAVACYCDAGFICASPRPRRTAAASLIAVFFGIVSLADALPASAKLLMLGACLARVVSLAALFSGREK